MTPMIRHVASVLRHKYYILRAGIRCGVPLRQLLVHDFSKFSRIERRGYAPYYHTGVPGGNRLYQREMDEAWGHHLAENPHHWEWWMSTSVPGTALQMDERCAREMVADWFAAARAYEVFWPYERHRREDWPWLTVNWDRIVLHPKTRLFVRRLLFAQDCAPPLTDAEFERVKHNINREMLDPSITPRNR